MGKPSLKKVIITMSQSFCDTTGAIKNKLVLITPAGLIIGTPLLEDNDYESAVLAKALTEVTKEYKTKYELKDDEMLDGNDGFLILKDAVLQTSFKETALPEVVVFFDQIIGATVGSVHSADVNK